MSGMVGSGNQTSSGAGSPSGDGCTERRNDRGWWVGKITYTRLRLKSLPVCDDCLINIHEQARAHHQAATHEGWLPRARWRRKNAVTGMRGMDSFRVTHLCDTHKQEWVDWTPGQLGMGLMSRGGGLA